MAERSTAEAPLIIESLGVYLPPRVVSTDDVVRDCKNPAHLEQIERLTGIRSRRMAGDGEFSIDLARKAAEDCLSRSRHVPEDVDLLISCSISRCDGPEHQFTFEPSTSLQLREQLGLRGAHAFDVSNACTGMFTGIWIAQAFLRAGLGRCAMIVSGEYVTHLTRTAQLEIDGFLDHRLACLTVGDAGAAVMVELGADDGTGFHELELFTLGEYSSLCVAKATDRPHGGAIMLTDSIPLTGITVKHAVAHASHLQQRGGWDPREIHHLIGHQTSRTTLDSTIVEVNRRFDASIFDRTKMIFNVAERGNTASTSHFVAAMDHIRNGRIRSGESVVFSITGSGVTVGTALYTFDDLPDRIRGVPPDRSSPASTPTRPRRLAAPKTPVRVCIESVGTLSDRERSGRSSIELATAAADDCLARSSFSRSEIDLLIHAGVYRDEFLVEPAIAALLAGALRIREGGDPLTGGHCLAFDVLDGQTGLLSACEIASTLIRTTEARNALLVASETENNTGLPEERLLGIRETGSALLLAQSSDRAGFGSFVFRYFEELSSIWQTRSCHEPTGMRLRARIDPRFEEAFLECLPGPIDELLEREGLRRRDIDAVLPPLVSPRFVAELPQRLQLSDSIFARCPDVQQNCFTSSIPHTIRQLIDSGRGRPGDVGLILSVGSGVKVGCAIYYF